MLRTYSTASEEETKKLAQDLIEKHISTQRTSALVFALEGELGAGKTRFVQGAAEFFGIRRAITSPTFVLMKRYDIDTESAAIARGTGVRKMYHLDCFRVHAAKEIEELGWANIVQNPAHIVFVEWPERIKDLLPTGTIHVVFKESEIGKKRIITVKNA